VFDRLLHGGRLLLCIYTGGTVITMADRVKLVTLLRFNSI